MSEHDQLPDELAALFSAERAAPVADAAVRAAVRSRLVDAIAHLPPGAAATGSAVGYAGKTLAVLAIVVAAGSGTVALVTSDEGPATSTTSTVATAPEREELPAPTPLPMPEVTRDPMRERTPAPMPAPTRIPSRTSNASTLRAPARVSSSQRVRPAANVAPTAVPSQAQLLRRAWALVSSGQPAEALALVGNDQQLHPDGVLAEERDALTVHALAKLQRMDDARAAAAGFIVRYPNSVHRAEVERAVEERP